MTSESPLKTYFTVALYTWTPATIDQSRRERKFLSKKKIFSRKIFQGKRNSPSFLFPCLSPSLTRSLNVSEGEEEAGAEAAAIPNKQNEQKRKKGFFNVVESWF
jgi:hypothetical protein